jgi:glycosyltransferase involved in cell wall biosynthesis
MMRRRSTRDPSGQLLVVTDSMHSYGDVLAGLVADHDARCVLLDPDHDGVRVLGKGRLLWRSIRWTTLREIRRAVRHDDDVVVFGWYSIGVLALRRAGLLRSAGSITMVGVFVHEPRLRRAAFALLRALGSRRHRAVAFSEDERAALVAHRVVRPGRAAHVVYRRPHDLVDTSTRAPLRSDTVVSVGYSNRDYRTLSAALDGLGCAAHLIVSEANLPDISAGPNVRVETDVPWTRYEEVMADAGVVVIPLRPGGDACGQSVLLTALKYRRPVVVTDHSAVHPYVGADYPGLVPAGDAASLRSEIERVRNDPSYADRLVRHLADHRARLASMGSMADDIAALVNE